MLSPLLIASGTGMIGGGLAGKVVVAEGGGPGGSGTSLHC